MVKINLTKKVRASSLLETVVAMVLIILVFGLAMMIFTNVTQSSLSSKKLRAQAIVSKTMLLTAQAGKPESNSSTIDGFRIAVEVKPYEKSPGLTEIDIAAYDDQQQLIAHIQKLTVHE